MKLALGTVQFGLAYGVANTAGQVPADEIGRILRAARQAGIDTLDTAIAYGDSEQRLGAAGVDGFEIVTKLPPLEDASGIAEAVGGSLARLRTQSLYAVLLHRAADLAGPHGEAIVRALMALKDHGIVRKIGVSIYEPQELGPLVPRYALDVIQAPYNVFDRRLETSGWLGRLAAAGVEVHVRSAFLQGLLLMAPASRPAKFAPWAAQLSKWDQFVANAGTAPLTAALGFACDNDAIDRVVVGIDSAAQLSEILAAYRSPHPKAPDTLAVADPRLINPANWNAL